MKNRDVLILILFGLTFLFFTNCSDKNEPQHENDLIGTWDYSQITISSCSNSNDNNVIDYSGEGNCQPSLGSDVCTKISLEMDEGVYNIKTTTDTDGTENTVITEEGTYSISFGSPYSSVIFCTNLVCRTETYIVSGNTLSVESVNPNNECNTIILAEKR